MSKQPNDQTDVKGPDWTHWNRVPVLTLREAICLTLNTTPYYDPGNAQTYDEPIHIPGYSKLLDIAQAHILNGSLNCLNPGYGQRSYEINLRAVDWLQWLRTIDISIPDGWRPAGFDRGDVSTDTDVIDADFVELETRRNSVGRRRREQYIDAAINMLPSTPKRQFEVLRQMENAREDDATLYSDCAGIGDDSLMKSIRDAAIGNEPPNPLDGPRYLQALEATDN